METCFCTFEQKNSPTLKLFDLAIYKYLSADSLRKEMEVKESLGLKFHETCGTHAFLGNQAKTAARKE